MRDRCKIKCDDCVITQEIFVKFGVTASRILIYFRFCFDDIYKQLCI
jgi:hypothetical protein